MDIIQYIKEVPKVDLHVHLEGTIEPTLLMKLATKNGIELPYKSVEEVHDAYNFRNLDHFLQIIHQGGMVLRDQNDFYDITKAYLVKARSQNTIHSEIFIDPQSHKRKGISMGEMLSGVLRATQEFKTQFGMTTSLILCFLRHHSEEEALDILETTKEYHHHFVAVGLAASEANNPPSKFVNLYKRAKELGFKLTAHAGEEGPASFINESIELLNIDRIDHGNSAINDPDLMKILVEKQIPLTMCPLSNLKLQVITDLHDHPMKRMMDMGINVTINSDDPSYFDGYLSENLIAMQTTFNLSRGEMDKILMNGIKAAYVTAERREELIKTYTAYVNNCQA